MAMIDLDDAMKVLTENGFLDPRYKNEKGIHSYIRSELEQKSYIYNANADQAIKDFGMIVNGLDIDAVSDHIHEGDLIAWLENVQISLRMSMERILRSLHEKEEKDGSSEQGQKAGNTQD